MTLIDIAMEFLCSNNSRRTQGHFSFLEYTQVWDLETGLELYTLEWHANYTHNCFNFARWPKGRFSVRRLK